MPKKKQKTKTLTKEDIVTTTARKIVWDCLTKGYNAKEAAEQAGLSTKYVQNMVDETGMKELALRETAAKTVDLREKVTKRLTRIVDSLNSADRDIIKASDVLGKMNGWQSSTLNLESPHRQTELTAIERQEAQRLALLRFNSLPGGIIDTERTSGVYHSEEKGLKQGLNGAETAAESVSEMPQDGQKKTSGAAGSEDPMTPQMADEPLYPSMHRKFSSDMAGSDIGIYGERLRDV